ncbi:methyltransferase type 11 [Tribonema minus]|uniref:Methyltransferase type 11 n=1 Tax=Tribonema minus TaxID=303371 RepID=A0A835YM46_9STRA|nr:methyltransferase type 11 [Tribonema minus]
MSAASTGTPPVQPVLSESDRRKYDTAPDAYWYNTPRLVFHVDSSFTSKLTDLYRERIPAGGTVLDMMSSWVSHLPSDVRYAQVDGHGLNREELQRNPQLTDIRVQDLNADPYLPFDSEQYDAVVCAVSVQYLQQPERIFGDVYRVLKPGGVAIFSFSNRMFGNKAITAWIDRDDAGRAALVSSYFRSVQPVGEAGSPQGFTEPEVIMKDASIAGIFASFAREVVGLNVGGDPFIAVVAYKDYKP